MASGRSDCVRSWRSERSSKDVFAGSWSEQFQDWRAEIAYETRVLGTALGTPRLCGHGQAFALASSYRRIASRPLPTAPPTERCRNEYRFRNLFASRTRLNCIFHMPSMQ